MPINAVTPPSPSPEPCPFPFLEIDITTRCNLGCFQCNRSCASHQAPSTPSEDVTVQQIQTFIQQSEALHYPWRRIRILGGEPTLHPHLSTIFQLIADYRLRARPNLEINLITNGVSNLTSDILRPLKGLFVANTHKTGRMQQDFVVFNRAPIDLNPDPTQSFHQGCELPKVCGLGLGFSGFYPCGLAASIDRVFGFDCGIKSLTVVNPTSIAAQCSVLCRYCGFFSRCYMPNVDPFYMSPSWARAYRAYQAHPPHLTRF